MTVLGVDVSEYQRGLDLAAAKAAGAQFVIARATRGPGLYADPLYRTFKTQARTLNLDFAAYHFMGESPAREAELIYNTEPGRRVPWMLDLEPSEKWGTTPTYAQALELRTRLAAADLRAPLLYFPRWYWEQLGRPNIAADGWPALVSSRYSLGYARHSLRELWDRADSVLVGLDGLQPYGGQTPAIWQFTSSAVIPGFTANTVDGDAYPGTLEELRAARLLRRWGPADTVDDVATSANGWPLLTSRTTGTLPRLRKWIIPGTDRHLLIRDGSVGFLLVHFALWWHERFNPLTGGVWDEWGWAPPRPVRGQTTGFSNHCSGTAADLDATEYPRGIPVLSRISAVNVARIRARLLLYRTLTGHPVLRWGGDYRNVPDGMHVEVNDATAMSQCEEVARRLMRTPRGKRILAANPGAAEVILS